MPAGRDHYAGARRGCTTRQSALDSQPMPVPNFAATVDHFASRLAADHTALARVWLERLDRLLSVEKRDVFPTHQLLNHIPTCLEIASTSAPPEQPIAANTAVMTKAAELGLLRFDQRASVHQLLREYQILARCSKRSAPTKPRCSASAVTRPPRSSREPSPEAVRVLQQKTVDAFITRYTETIESKTAQLAQFQPPDQPRDPAAARSAAGRGARVMSCPKETPKPPLVETLERNVVRLGEVATKLERLTRLTSRLRKRAERARDRLPAVATDVVEQLRTWPRRAA